MSVCQTPYHRRPEFTTRDATGKLARPVGPKLLPGPSAKGLFTSCAAKLVKRVIKASVFLDLVPRASPTPMAVKT